MNLNQNRIAKATKDDNLADLCNQIDLNNK